MTINTSDSIDDMIELLSNADQGDRLSIDLPDAPTYVVVVVSNDSVAPTDDSTDPSTDSLGNIQVNATVDYDHTPVAEPEGIGHLRSISASRDTDTGAFTRPTLGVMVKSPTSQSGEREWVADPQPIERIDMID